jgi:hypothetical protein
MSQAFHSGSEKLTNTPFFCGWILGIFLLLAIVSNDAMNKGV